MNFSRVSFSAGQTIVPAIKSRTPGGADRDGEMRWERPPYPPRRRRGDAAAVKPISLWLYVPTYVAATGFQVSRRTRLTYVA